MHDRRVRGGDRRRWRGHGYRHAISALAGRRCRRRWRCRAISIRWRWSPGGAAMAAGNRGRSWTAMRGRPFMFNLGHGIVPQTPPEHVAALVELVRGGLDGRGRPVQPRRSGSAGGDAAVPGEPVHATRPSCACRSSSGRSWRGSSRGRACAGDRELRAAGRQVAVARD